MKKLFVAGIAAAAFYGAPALAADLPTKAPVYKPSPAPMFNWTGFYLGVNAGVGVAGTRARVDDPIVGNTGHREADGLFNSGFTGGFQAGYNWQLAPSWVVGFEGDVGILNTNKSICDINDCFASENIHITSKSGFLATARGRFGYAWDRSLLYVTGGAAWIGVEDNYAVSTGGGTTFSQVSTTKSGWVLGGGIESALVGNWTLKAEYLFIDPGSIVVLRSNGDGTFMNFEHDYHVARLGLNYKFGDGLSPSAASVIPVKASPLAYAAYNWTGFYIGANAGVGAAGTKLTTDPTATIGNNNGDTDYLHNAGFTGGFQEGFNWQLAQSWVVGIEGDVGVLNTSEHHNNINDNSYDFTAKSGFFSTLRGRVGYAWDRSLLYVTGGGAWVRVTDTWTESAVAPANQRSATRSGWTVGGGLEAALAGNWTTKFEYLYADVGTNRVIDADGDGSYLNFRHEFHVFKFGLNYKFVDLGNALVSAKY